MAKVVVLNFTWSWTPLRVWQKLLTISLWKKITHKYMNKIIPFLVIHRLSEIHFGSMRPLSSNSSNCIIPEAKRMKWNFSETTPCQSTLMTSCFPFGIKIDFITHRGILQEKGETSQLLVVIRAGVINWRPKGFQCMLVFPTGLQRWLRKNGKHF